jgi:hypothetical protein
MIAKLILKLERSQRHLKCPSTITAVNLSSTQEKALTEPNFIILGKISLKKYYESTEEYSLFQRKGYSLRADAIRKNNL